MKTAIIIGAGPAGLTAAYELLTRTDIIPIVIEADTQVGGLSKTIDYKGNKIDIGGHRFFSKSQRVINWWLQFLPLEPSASEAPIHIKYQQKEFQYQVPNRETDPGKERLMLLRPRKSRIFYNHKFFDYPLRLNNKTLKNLGLVKIGKVGLSYVWAKLFQEKPELHLASFFRNRFGNELYITFFKDYTEKVWGVPCEKIPSSWGQQRIKDLNISRLLFHALKSLFYRSKDLQQKGTSTSLIEQFLYPKLGPGQMWETVAEQIVKRNGKLLLNMEVVGIQGDGKNRLLSVQVRDKKSQVVTELTGDYFFSSMPVKDLVMNTKGLSVPADSLRIATALEYRDFLIVGLLVDALSVKDKETKSGSIEDNWIYIQDKNVKAGRLQIFNNWSPFMVKDPNTVWLGVEYFCNEKDGFWQLTDTEISALAIKEMQGIGLLESASVKDVMVARVPKAYPSYYGSYEEFIKVRSFLDTIENLFLVGRNGMHRYNNSDHSMLTAMTAVENIMEGRLDKSNIWEVNTEEEYHEIKKEEPLESV